MKPSFKCDRCGEYFHKECDSYGGYKPNAILQVDGGYPGEDWVYCSDYEDPVALCPSCMAKLNDWLHGEQKPPKEKIEVGQAGADWIISDPKACRKSLFWHYDEDSGKYVGIDNTTGEAWTEEFATKQECFDWLDGKEKE